MAAQEGEPLTGIWNRWSEGWIKHHLNRVGAFFRQCAVDARHDRKMIRALTFVSVAKIGHHVVRRLTRFGQQQCAGLQIIQRGAEEFDDQMHLWQAFAGRAVFFPEKRHGVRPNAVHAFDFPADEHPRHVEQHVRMLVIQIRLNFEKAMEIILPGNFVFFPIRIFHPFHQQAGVRKSVRRIAPDVIRPFRRVFRLTRLLKPGMLIRGMVDRNIKNQANAPRMGFRDKFSEDAIFFFCGSGCGQP